MTKKLTEILMYDAEDLFKLHSAKFGEGIDVLITGGTGLIGINLLAYFYNAQRKKMAINVTVHINSTEHYLNELFPDNSFQFFYGDLSADIPFLSKRRYDVIFHLATYGQPGRFLSEKVKTLELNSIALINLIKRMKEGGRFFFSSSSEVYSGNNRVPHVETEGGFTNTTHPRSAYIEAKRFGEAYCYAASSNGVRTYIGRISLAYGPGYRLQDQRVLNQFIIQAIAKREIRMLDDGSAQRVYCYTKDTLDTIFRLIWSDVHDPVNIAGTSRISINELANQIGKKCEVSVVQGTANGGLAGAPPLVFSSVDKAANVLGKASYVSLDEGLTSAIAWGRGILGA